MIFHHTPNNNIRINNGDASYFDSLEHFLLDWSGDYSGLPEGYRELQLEGERRAIYTGNSQESMPDELADEIITIIENLSTIIANKNARNALAEGA